MNIKIVDQAGQEVVADKGQEVKEGTGTVSPTGEIMFNSISQMFDLKPNEAQSEKSRLTTIIEYAISKTDDHSPEGIKWAIRSLASKLGTPPLGEKMIPYLARYAYLQTNRAKLEKDIEKYEKTF